METKPTKIETLLGGAEITVAHLDGTLENVKIRQIPVKEFRAYLLAQEDECKMIEMFCSKPAGWAETLAPEYFEAVVIEGERINTTDFFTKWTERLIARQRRLSPAMAQRQSPSPTGSQKLPSSAT